MKASRKRSASRVTFTGPVNDAAAAGALRRRLVFVCPSRYEGFGLPVLEAMALGTPVVCADAASLPEVAGEAALLFPAGEQATLATTLARVLRDPVLRHELVVAGRARAARFAWADHGRGHGGGLFRGDQRQRRLCVWGGLHARDHGQQVLLASASGRRGDRGPHPVGRAGRARGRPGARAGEQREPRAHPGGHRRRRGGTSAQAAATVVGAGGAGHAPRAAR